MFEWDWPSYERKFAATQALTRVDGGNWKWRCIRSIGEEGVVIEFNNPSPIGEVYFESNNGKPQTTLPMVEFKYAPISPGVYGHRFDLDSYFTVSRKHNKSFKIGLSSEAYKIVEWTKGIPLAVDYRCWIDLTNRKTGLVGKHNVFTENLVLNGKSLLAFDTEIGFLEGTRAILKDPNFIPLVQPYLGDKWEIVSL